ncbi:MAG TPA: metal ABC transporter permease [Chitinophagales bacterium]|nr:metal ABC transporter permease [Chitinophagales bacterium]
MTSTQIEIQLIASIVSIACAIPGVFLVLRKMSLISDAISHSILLGIVLGFFITQDTSSPLLILMAGLTGVMTVVFVEIIQKTGLVKEDTAIGLVFPALFSIGVILIAKNANDIHLDIDAVLLGELAFAPFNRWYISDIDMGPKSMWVMGGTLLITLTLLGLFYKELKISTFDPGLSAALGFSPALIHYSLMSVSSVTIVGAFDAVGAILVVALMIVPAASAYLITHNLKTMLILAILFGVSSAISGYWLANLLNASIAGSIATMLGVFFFLIYLLAPRRGLIAHIIRGKRQRREVMLLTFLLHLHNLQEDNDEAERDIKHLHYHFKWNIKQSKNILKLAVDNGLVQLENNKAYLTEKGEKFCDASIFYIIDNNHDEIKAIKNKFLIFRG